MTPEDLDRAIAALEQIKAERQAQLAELQAKVLILRATLIAHGVTPPTPFLSTNPTGDSDDPSDL